MLKIIGAYLILFAVALPLAALEPVYQDGRFVSGNRGRCGIFEYHGELVTKICRYQVYLDEETDGKCLIYTQGHVKSYLGDGHQNHQAVVNWAHVVMDGNNQMRLKVEQIYCAGDGTNCVDGTEVFNCPSDGNGHLGISFYFGQDLVNYSRDNQGKLFQVDQLISNDY